MRRGPRCRRRQRGPGHCPPAERPPPALPAAFPLHSPVFPLYSRRAGPAVCRVGAQLGASPAGQGSLGVFHPSRAPEGLAAQGRGLCAHAAVWLYFGFYCFVFVVEKPCFPAVRAGSSNCLFRASGQWSCQKSNYGKLTKDTSRIRRDFPSSVPPEPPARCPWDRRQISGICETSSFLILFSFFFLFLRDLFKLLCFALSFLTNSFL